jgi:hypothetical protein
MTIIEAINLIDSLKPNTYSIPDKVRWLSNLDWMIKTEIIDTHEGAEEKTFGGYTEETPFDTPLLVSAPHEDVYIKWLETQIDYVNGEYGRYNNSMTAFNSAYSTFSNYYNRTHMPKGTEFKFIGGKKSLVGIIEGDPLNQADEI